MNYFYRKTPGFLEETIINLEDVDNKSLVESCKLGSIF